MNETVLKKLADLVGGTLSGSPDTPIRGVAGIREARAGEITFIANRRYLKDLAASRASAVIAGKKVDAAIPQIIVDDPYFAFRQVVVYFHPPEAEEPGVHPTAVLADAVKVSKSAAIRALVSIGSRSVVGDGTVIHSGTVVGRDVVIGDDCRIFPNVTIRDGCRIGNRVILHSGVVIGSDGFGFATHGGTHHKIPQVGIVEIHDDVEIGANVTVDRAAMGRTVVGRGTKIDNLVQVAHNVEIGEDCLIVAQAGISGSTRLGRHVILAGQVGVVGHVVLGDGVQVGAQSGIAADVRAGEVVSGSPAISHKDWLRAQAVFAKLPQLHRDVARLRQRLAELEGKLDGGGKPS